jgi:hypothetical protein
LPDHWGLIGPQRRHQPAYAPITRTREASHEELIELETQAAERWVGREWPGQRTYVEGVLATLGWAWRASGVPPLEVEAPHAS